MTRTRYAGWLAPTVAVLALGGLSGCADDQPSEEKDGDAQASASADGRVPSGYDGDLKDPRGAARDLDGFTCAPKDGAWRARGAVKNAAADAGSYVVTVTLVRRATSEVLSRQARTLVVQPGEREPFEVELSAPDDGPKAKLECVARVVRGDASTPAAG